MVLAFNRNSRRQAGHRNIVFDIPMQLVGVPPSPGLAALRPVERTCRCGSMLRMTSREKVTQQRHGDSRRAAQGACPLYGAKRCKLPGAVSRQRAGQQPRRAHEYTPAGGYRSAPFLATALKGFQPNLVYEVPGPIRAGLPVQLPTKAAR